MNLTKVIIPAAGYGTRFLPITKSIPKEMLPIINKPAIEYIIQEAILSGINDFCVITSKGKEAISDYFRSSKKNGKFHQAKKLNDLEDIINFSNFQYIQQDRQLGLGHAVLMAKECITDDFFGVMLPDDLIVSNKPCLKQLIDLASAQNACVIAVQEIPQELTSSYGVVKIKNKLSQHIFEISDLIEKPAKNIAPSNLGIIGRYILCNQIFGILEKLEPGANGEIQLTDAISNLVRSGQAVFAYKIDGLRYDIGTPVGWLKANNEISKCIL